MKQGSHLVTKDVDQDPRMQSFRQLLRRADKLILESQFDEAWLELAEAAKLQPNHAMLTAFKERLELAQRADDLEGHVDSGPPPPESLRDRNGLIPTNGKAARPHLTTDTIETPIEPEKEESQQELTLEYQSRFFEEREAMRRQYETKEAALEESIRQQFEQRQAEGERKFQEQLKHLRESNQEELERKLAALRADVEAEVHGKFEGRLAEERERLQSEMASAVEAERKKQQEDASQKLLEQVKPTAQEYGRMMEFLGAKIPDTEQERMSYYREKLRRCYGNGHPSGDDERALVQLRELLHLKLDDHLAAESGVRLELYVEAVAKSIRSGELNFGDTTALEDLKKQFGITSDESSRLEPYIFSSFQRLAVKGRILLVDDHQPLLDSLAGLLTDHGFQVIQASSIESALEKLGSTSIDLILSELRFATGELDGFKFFRIVADQQRSHSIPFVLMSALDDGVIIRSGMQLGVDAYLTKPIDNDMLISVIEGKMRRYRNPRRG